MSQPSQNDGHHSQHTLAIPEGDATCYTTKLLSRVRGLLSRQSAPKRVFPRLPQTQLERREASLTEKPLDATSLEPSDIRAAEEKHKTVLYLAYGSNLCNETFRGVRGIRPLSQINVVVPSLRLTFDLPGIPYNEPCFANSAVRDTESKSRRVGKTDYHKDRWHKGMVGCVYEVTVRDYAHIIATEGGGASYEDVLVDCYPLEESSDVVPSEPTTEVFKAHTLFAPATPSTATRSATSRLTRPDPSYAQPSPRYLKLITDGATELSLPREYQAYLHDIRTYKVTSRRQAIGKALFTTIWMPILMMVFSLGKIFQDKHGRNPKWLSTVFGWLFIGMWTFYDGGFSSVFGDGERTDGDTADDNIVDGYKDDEPKGNV
jgi:hypothetical protein